MKKFTIRLSDENVVGKKITIPLNALEREIKVEEAWLNISNLNANGNSEHRKCRVDFTAVAQDKTESWANVDTINLDMPNNKINISDEIQQALNMGAEKIILEFDCDSTLNFDKEIEINYHYLTDFNEEITQSFTLGRAGEVKYDFFNKKLSLNALLSSSEKFALPLSVFAHYNQAQNYLAIENGLPKNWNISLQQFLKRKDDLTKLDFIYIDENGKNQTLEERYYYLSDDVKHFVSHDELEVNYDGELVYKTIISGQKKEFKVEKILEAPSGLKLASSIKDIKGEEYVEHEPEELSQVKKQIKNLENNKEKYEKSLSSLKKQIYIAGLNKELGFLDNKDRQENVYKQNQSANQDPPTKVEAPSKNVKKIYLENLTLDESKSIVTKHIGNSDIFSEKELSQFYDEILNSAQKTLPDTQSENNTDENNAEENNENEVPYLVLSDINIYGSQTAIENYIDQFNQQTEDLGEINRQIEILQNKLFHLEMQVPVHYLYNEEYIYGFGKANEEGDLFRLVLVSDANENAVYINYKNFDSQEIENIIDSKENVINFEYENGKLASIIDSRDRKISFKQGSVFEISHFDGNKSVYKFANNQLAEILDSSGKGFKIEYSTDEVVIKSLSLIDKVCNGKVEYKNKKTFDELANSDLSDCEIDDEQIVIHNDNLFSTTITTKNSLKTYLFDQTGKVKSIYEYEKDEDEKSRANVVVFNYQTNSQSNRMTQKITPLVYPQNYLKDVCFDKNSFKTHPRFVMGQTVCQTLQYQSFYQTHEKYHSMTAGVDTVEASEKMIDEINNSDELNRHKTLMLSGWAKADSAYIEENGSISARKFEISAEIEDENGEKYNFARAFDYRNTDWQYLALPIVLPPACKIKKLTCKVDYSGNTGEIQYTDLELKQANLEEVTYDIQNRPIKIVNAHSHFVKEYAYLDESNLLSTETITNTKTNEKFVTDYAYSSTGKLLRTTDYNGIVEENVYDQKGSLIKTLTYHKDEPTSAFCQENLVDENGTQSETINSLGEKISKK